jgi:hypothetical protein
MQKEMRRRKRGAFRLFFLSLSASFHPSTSRSTTLFEHLFCGKNHNRSARKKKEIKRQKLFQSKKLHYSSLATTNPYTIFARARFEKIRTEL